MRTKLLDDRRTARFFALIQASIVVRSVSRALSLSSESAEVPLQAPNAPAIDGQAWTGADRGQRFSLLQLLTSVYD